MAKQIKVQNVMPEENRRIGIKAPLDKISGAYSNVALIHHSKNEFVFDFVFDLMGDMNLVSRVITNPAHMKKLYKVMGENITKYEKKFGKIIIDNK